MNTNVKMTRQEVEEEIKVLEKIFDVVRILDGEFLSKMQENPCVRVQLGMCKCYEFWKKNKPCENCISVKAYTERSCNWYNRSTIGTGNFSISTGWKSDRWKSYDRYQQAS